MTALTIGKLITIFSFFSFILIVLCSKIFKKEYKKINTNGFAYIDLGLPSGTLWAVSNVGTLDSKDGGDFFEFGSKISHHTFCRTILWDKSIFNLGSFERNDSLLINKHDLFFDENNNLRKGFDIVNAHMGGDWVMPTEKDIIELINKTYHCRDAYGFELISNTSNGLEKIIIPYGLNNGLIMSSTISDDLRPKFLFSDGSILYSHKVERNVLCHVRGVIHRQIKPSIYESMKFKLKAFWINLKRKI